MYRFLTYLFKSNLFATFATLTPVKPKILQNTHPTIIRLVFGRQHTTALLYSHSYATAHRIRIRIFQILRSRWLARASGRGGGVPKCPRFVFTGASVTFFIPLTWLLLAYFSSKFCLHFSQLVYPLYFYDKKFPISLYDNYIYKQFTNIYSYTLSQALRPIGKVVIWLHYHTSSRFRVFSIFPSKASTAQLIVYRIFLCQGLLRIFRLLLIL